MNGHQKERQRRRGNRGLARLGRLGKLVDRLISCLQTTVSDHMEPAERTRVVADLDRLIRAGCRLESHLSEAEAGDAERTGTFLDFVKEFSEQPDLHKPAVLDEEKVQTTP